MYVLFIMEQVLKAADKNAFLRLILISCSATWQKHLEGSDGPDSLSSAALFL